MKRKILVLISIFVSLIFFLSGPAVFAMGKTAGENANLKIGAAIALTGYGAAFGQSELNAMQILKDKYPDIEFSVEDNKSDPKAGITAIRKLIDLQDVDIIYCDLTTVANAAIPLINESKRILIAAVYLNDLISRCPFSIRNLPRGIDESRVLLTYLFENNDNPKQIAIVGSNDEFGRSSIEDFKTVSSEFNTTIIFEDLIPDNGVQIKSLAEKISSKAPDTVYTASLMPNLGLLIKELRQVGYKGAIITTDAFSYPYIRAAAGQFAKGTIYVDFPSTPRLETFSSIYKKKFETEPATTAVFFYDGISLLIEQSHKDRGDLLALLSGLDGLTYDGLFGKLLVKGREIIYPVIVNEAK